MSKSIDIGFADLCVEIRKLDETLIPQVTVSMVSKKTGTVQDICMVGPGQSVTDRHATVSGLGRCPPGVLHR